MTSVQFCYWLQGYLELSMAGSYLTALTTEQLEMIKNHLNMVFIHEIDPSYPTEQQEALDAAHTGNPVPLSQKSQFHMTEAEFNAAGRPRC